MEAKGFRYKIYSNYEWYLHRFILQTFLHFKILLYNPLKKGVKVGKW